MRAGPALLALAALALGGCTTTAAAPVAHAPGAGDYPVATPGAQVLATPTASDAHYQLVSAGDLVRADVGAARVLARVTGPELTVPTGTPAAHAPGVLTVALRAEQGTSTVPAGSFLLLDQVRHPIAVHADAAAVTVTPAAPAVLHLSGELPAGHATLTWQPTGHPMVTWDLVIEID